MFWGICWNNWCHLFSSQDILGHKHIFLCCENWSLFRIYCYWHEPGPTESVLCEEKTTLFTDYSVFHWQVVCHCVSLAMPTELKVNSYYFCFSELFTEYNCGLYVCSVCLSVHIYLAASTASVCVYVCDCSQVSPPGSRLISSVLRITGSMNGLFSLPSFSLITDRTSTFLSLRFPNTNNAATHRTTLQKMSLVSHFNHMSMLTLDLHWKILGGFFFKNAAAVMFLFLIWQWKTKKKTQFKKSNQTQMNIVYFTVTLITIFSNINSHKFSPSENKSPKRRRISCASLYCIINTDWLIDWLTVLSHVCTAFLPVKWLLSVSLQQSSIHISVSHTAARAETQKRNQGGKMMMNVWIEPVNI